MTEKENFLRIAHGEMPEWIPLDAAHLNPPDFPIAVRYIRPELVGHASGKDMFGVEFVGTDSTGGMGLPVPNKFILKDIHDWPNVIKVPDINDFDFDAIGRKCLEGINRDDSAIDLSSHNGYFIYLMNFMGFSEGLFTLACYQDEVYDMFNYMADFFDEFFKRLIDAVKPDIFSISDDIASAQNTFMSRATYQQLIKPFQARLVAHAMKLGIPVNMHCCGKCEDFIEDWFDLGVTMWNPPQDMNDLVGIKKKYGRRLAMNGCSSSQDAFLRPDATEEEVRECVRKKIDTYAPGGAYIFRGYLMGHKDDTMVRTRNQWMVDEFLKYGRPWYKNHA